jgi:XTP/dITP diphosphohydrolase
VAFPPRIAVASRNAHKLREIERICAAWPVEWLTAGERDDRWPDVEETGATYLENARLKARAVAAALGEPALADDSGIEVDALAGGPGPRSARFAGEGATDERNLDELIRAVRGVPSAGRTARYRCVVVLAAPDGAEHVAEGTCEGVLRIRYRWRPRYVRYGGPVVHAPDGAWRADLLARAQGRRCDQGGPGQD